MSSTTRHFFLLVMVSVALQGHISAQSNCAVHASPGGTLTLCNNIVINNHGSGNTDFTVTASNIVTDTDSLFTDNVYNYVPKPQSAAVNAGQNSCNPLPQDMATHTRVMSATIDIGAFEQFLSPQEVVNTVAVHASPGGTLTLCNNIVINNHGSGNTDFTVTVSNIVTDTDSLFTDNVYNYVPKPQSATVNAGQNSCNPLPQDMATHERILSGVIDIGAYEQFVAHSDVADASVVLQVNDSNGLTLYNNIVINNPLHQRNVDSTIVGSHNLIEDVDGVFLNAETDFRLWDGSPAVNAGENQHISLQQDLNGDSRRACEGTVDIGAFELQPETHNLTVTATTLMNDNCSGHVTRIVATGGERYAWSHSNITSDTVVVNPLVTTCYTVTAYWDGDCPWTDTATICVDPNEVIENEIGTPSTSGQRFWVSFMKNHLGTPTLSLLVSAQNACTGMISNPNTGWSSSFSVNANQTVQVAIPNSQAYCSTDGMVLNRGLLVTSSENISLYASNFEDFTYDVTNVLPESALSNEYVAQAYTPLFNTEFLVVATEDETVVEIIPSKRTADEHTAYEPYTITLNQGQCYLVLSKYGGVNGDMSGSVIRSTDPGKPLAVFNGNVCANIPVGNMWCDHVVEQAFGTRFWGRQFVITNTVGMPYDRIKITASANNTSVTKNGAPLTTLQAHQSYEFQLSASEEACCLETSNACAVYLYVPGGQLNPSPFFRGDPSMVWVSPIEQRIGEITFSTFNSPNITNHYVNVVAPTASVSSVMCDNVSLSSQFHQILSNPMYSYARVSIANGTHTLSSSQGIVAHVYGTGHCETYSYSVGSKAATLSEQMYVNHVLNTDLENNVFCTYEDIPFDAVVNYQCDSVVWNFGDAYENFSGMHLSHHYVEGGTFPVSMTVFLNDEYGQHCSTIYSQVVINDGDYVIYYDTVCQGDTYLQNGFVYEADTFGTVTLTRSVDIPGVDCDSTYVTELLVHRKNYDFYDTICVGNVYQDYGFQFTPAQAGAYCLADTVLRIPCDSISVLHLLVTPNVNDLYGIHGMETVCPGGVYGYYLDTLSGLHDIEWQCPNGMILLSGQGTDHVELLVTEDAVEGDIVASGANSCGSTSFSTHISPQPIYYVKIQDTLCGRGQPYHRYGFDIDSVQDEYAVFVKNLLSETCCDSTIVLSLVVVDVPKVTVSAENYSVCQGLGLPLVAVCEQGVVNWTDSLNETRLTYNWSTGDTTATAYLSTDTSMSVNVNVMNEFGCVAVGDTLINVIPVVYSFDTLSICATQLPYVYVDTVFPVGTTSGDYTFRRIGSSGCDSIMSLQLIVKNPTDSTFVINLGQEDLPFVLNDSLYMETGVYVQHLLNSVGCDSIITLHLTVINNTELYMDTTVCQYSYPLLWHGHLFVESGSVRDTMILSNGTCQEVFYRVLSDTFTLSSPISTSVICFGDTSGSASFVVSGGVVPVSCQWSDMNGGVIGTTTSLNNVAEGTYIFTASDGMGCVVSDTILINTLYAELQSGVIEEDQAICEGTLLPEITGTLATGGDEGYYQWQVSLDGFGWEEAPGENGLQNYSYPYPATGNFFLRRNWISQSCGQVATNSLSVEVFSTYRDTIFAETCRNVPYLDNGFVINADEVSEVGVFEHEQLLESIRHCDSVVVLMLTVHEVYEQEESLLFCENDLPTIYGGIEINVDAPETEVITFSSVNGCDSVVTLHLTIIDTSLQIVSLTDDFCEEMSAELMAESNMQSYIWNTGETSPQITVYVPGFYSVTASMESCSNSHRFFVADCQYQMLLPNTITPSNRDGLNDFFFVPEEYLSKINLFEISVFNRWGELVFSSNDKCFRWDGEYRGQNQYQAVYNYVIRYTDFSGRPYRIIGSVTVL